MDDGLRLLYGILILGLAVRGATGLDRRLWGGPAPDPLAVPSRLMVGCGMLILLFHLLAALGQFRLLPALAALALLACFFSRGTDRSTPDDTPAEPKETPDSSVTRPPLKIGDLLDVGVFTAAGLVFLTALWRAFLYPPWSWDSWTYHIPIPATWIQEGGYGFWPSPGMWSAYQWFPANGETLIAWSMLGPHSDDLAGFVPLIPLLLALTSLRALGIGSGLSRRTALLTALVLITPPCYLQLLTTAEIDLTLFAFLSAGAAFTRYATRLPARRRPPCLFLAGLAWGAAAGTKVFGLPALLVLGAWGLVLRIRGQVSTPVFLVTALVALAPWAPWAIRAAAIQGNPVWPKRVIVAGHTIFPGEPELEAMLRELDVRAQEIRASQENPDLEYLDQTFSLRERNLGPVLLLALLLGAAGLPRSLLGSTDLAPAIVLAGMQVFLFFSPSLAGARTVFAYSYGRFLGYPAAVLLILGIAGLPERIRDGALVRGILRALLIAHLLRASPYGYAVLAPSWSYNGVVVALSMTAMAITWLFRDRGRPTDLIRGIQARAAVQPRVLGVVVTAVLIVGLGFSAPAWRALRLERRTVFPLLESSDQRLRIAATAGHDFFGQNQLWALIMGRDFQNTIRYVPITADGSIISYRDSRAAYMAMDRDAWLARLDAGAFTHLVNLKPIAPETVHASRLPGIFRPVAGPPNAIWEINRDALHAHLEQTTLETSTRSP